MHPNSPSSRTSGLGVTGALTLLLAACSMDATPASDGSHHVAHRADGTPALIRGALGTDTNDAVAFLGVDEAALTAIDAREDALGFTTTRLTQTVDGLPVVGGDVRVVRNPAGRIISVAGASTPLGGATPTIAAGDARTLAFSSTTGASSSSDADLVYVAPSSGLAATLSWRVTVVGRDGEHPIHDVVFVDAVTGEIVDRHPQVHSVRNRLTYDAQNQTEGTFPLARTEADVAPSGDPDIDFAHDFAGNAYTCFAALFGRDSYNGAGADMRSIANVGVDYQNALWNAEQQYTAYGDGFANAFDVVAHEWTHAITSETAALIYQNESGALNEAMSDIIAAACEHLGTGVITENTWLVGENLPIGALRDMSDPVRDTVSRDHYSTRYLGTEDNGGVHLNSGIANLAFALLVEGGAHPRRTDPVAPVVAVGMVPATQVFYRALTVYLTPTSDFAAARAATEQAAADLFGMGSSEQISVSEAWAAVGVGDAAPDRSEPEPEPEPEPETDPEGEIPGGTLTGGCQATGSSGTGGALAIALLGLLVARRRRSGLAGRR